METPQKRRKRGKQKRTVETNENKTYQRADRVTVLGLVCEKLADRVPGYLLDRKRRTDGRDRRYP